MLRYLFLVLLLALASGCGSRRELVQYYVTTDSRMSCCRTLQYSTAEFPERLLAPSTTSGDSVVVRISGDTITGLCSVGAPVSITIANNIEGSDIYIPFSHELHGDSVDIYPWRLMYEENRPLRIARQLQYGDLIERTDARLRFYRIPKGRQITLKGIISGRWLCIPPSAIFEGYLEGELDPTFYADKSRALRGLDPVTNSKIFGAMDMRYDVVYTTLDFIGKLPIKEVKSNDNGDTVRMHVAAPESPAELLNPTQKVAVSNKVVLVVE